MFDFSAAVADESFGLGAFWAVVGSVAGVLALGGVIVALVTFRRQFPKRRLEYTVESRRLLSQKLPEAAVQLTVHGVKVREAYFTTVRMRSNSRADIPSSAFDGGRAISMRVEPGGALLLNGDSEVSDGIRIGGGQGEAMTWAEFTIEPQLIRKKSTGDLTFISEGEPTVKITSPLIDIEVRPVLSERDALRRSVRRDVVQILVLGFGVVTAGGIAIINWLLAIK
jgi:hypothetical protein